MKITTKIISISLLAIISFSNNVKAQNVTIPDTAFKSWVLANVLHPTSPTEITTTEAAAYTGSMYLGFEGISDLTGIEAFTSLTSLNFGYNSVSSVNLSSNTALTSLYCSANALTSLDVSTNTALISLSCTSNLLTSLDLSHNTALVDLYCDYNNLSSLNLQNGNNANMPHGNGLSTGFDAVGNPNLSCILVDNVAYSTANWEYKDASASFSTTCSAVAVVNNIHTIAAGGNHSAYIISDSYTAAAGENTQGALGDNTSVTKLMPVKVHTIIGQSSPSTESNVLTDTFTIAAGKTHTLFLKNNGTVSACGSNLHGELGQDDIFDRWGTVMITSLSNVTAIAAGTNYSLFLKADGTVWACGSNMYGNLGVAGTSDTLIPVQIMGLTDIVAIAAGKENSLFLKSDGTVWGCGLNANGELGNGTVDTHSSPIHIDSLTDIVAISEGDTHSLFLKSNGTVWACGKNAYGQLGTDTYADSYTPVMIPNLTGITAIAAGGEHSLCLKNNGTVWGCGSNSNGQLDSDSIFDRWGNMIQISNPSDTYTEIAAGSTHTILKKSDGTFWGCGMNTKGQLGVGTTIDSYSLIQVILSTIINFLASGQQPIASGSNSSGSYFLCSSSGTPSDCGYNVFGEMGDGTTVNKNRLVSVSGLTGITAMSGGSHHSLFLKNDGTVWACGRNNYGQLGDGTTTNKTIPVQVHGPNNIGFLTGIIAIAAGSTHTLFLKNDGTVWVCGGNFYQQLSLGMAPYSTTPVQLGLTGITAIAAGADFSLFLKNDGTVWSCGQNNYGQLSTGTIAYSAPMSQVIGLTGIISISGGGYHSLFLKNDGTVWACGQNNYGQLGDFSTTDKHSPVQVHGPNNVGFLTDISAISVGYYHSVFLKDDNTVWTCGANGNGQLGDFTTIQRNTPVQVHGPNNVGFFTAVVTIASGSGHSLFLKNDNTAWACGTNSSGQLGDGTLTQRTTPVQMQYSHSIPNLSASANPLCNGSTTILSIASGNLNGATNWQWYTGSCGGTPVGSGTSISVGPAITTTYYVRAEGGCITTGNCASITVTPGPLPSLGSYPNKTVVAGRNTTVTPNAVPTNTVHAVAYANTSFTGVLTVNPTTGLLTITDAKQAGIYTITVKAFNCGGFSSIRTFTLTVTNPNCSQGKLYGTTNMVVGHVPQSVAVGDFNGDGNQDIVTAALDDVYLNLGNGNGSFGTTTHIVIGSSNTITGGVPRSVAVGDFNRDGKQDIAVANEASSTVSIRLGDGIGGFTGSTNVPVGIGPTFVTVGDFNGDNKQDIAVSYFNSNIISTNLGDGNGGFSPYQYLIVGIGPYSMVVGDFNSDGKQDIAVTVVSNKIAVRFGLGDGTFNGNTDLAVGTSPNYLAIGDFNGDGKQDLATTIPNNVSTFIGNGNGSFSNSINSNVGSASGAIAVGDFNGDGKQDITKGNGNGTVSILSGNGLGTFITNSNVSIDGSFENAIAVGDFNNDSKQDFVTSNWYSNSNNNSVYKISVRLGGANEINVQGNNSTIADNDYTPSTNDFTDFGSVCRGSSLVHTYTIQNTGITDLTLPAGGMEILANGNPSPDFTISGITLPATIAAGSSATFDVTFAPTTGGTKIANLSIANDDCNESNYNFNLKGISVPTPTVTQPANRSYCSGVIASTISFTGGVTGNTYSWTNNNTSIGLAASGTGSIQTFTTANTTTLPITATIMVTPSITSAGSSCSGTPVSFTITVNPLPAVTQPGNLTVCNGDIAAAVNFINTLGGEATWTNNKPSIGIPASGSGDISSFTAVNTTSSPVTATITVTPTKPSFAYIPNLSSNTVSVINTFTNLVVATIPVGLHPYGVSVSLDGTKVLITNLDSDNVSVISTATNTVIATIPVGNGPIGVCFRPNGTKAYVVNSLSNSVSVIDALTNAVTATVPVGGAPGGIAISPNGSKVYVANAYSHTVSVINALTNTVAATITVGGFPWGVAVNPAGTKVYITNRSSNLVSVINTSTNALTSIPLLSPSWGVAFSPNGTKAYVGSTSTYVSVINPATDTVTTTVSLGSSSGGITVTPNGSKIYVANISSLKVSVINALTNTLTTTIPTGEVFSLGNFITPAGCHGAPATFTITVNPTPTVTQLVTQAVCNGTPTSAIHFTGLVVGTSYNWTNSNPSIGLAASGTGDISSFTAINTSSVSVLAIITVTPSTTTGALSCAGAPRTFVIAVKPTPTLGITAYPSPNVCAGNTVRLTGIGATTYSWTGGITNNIAFTPTTTTTYTVTGTKNGCSNTATQTVTVNPLPIVGVQVSPSSTVCSGTSVTLNGTGATTYIWNGGRTNGVPFIATATATYTVTGTTTATGCFAKATQTITVNPLPAAVKVSGGGFIQCGRSAVLTAIGGTGGTIYWQGTTSGGTSTTTASTSQTVNTSGTYYFRSQSAAGCWGPEGSVTVTINTVVTPTIAAGGNTTFCQGGSVVLTSSSATGNTWSNGATTQSITVASSGSYSVTVSNGSCSATSKPTVVTVTSTLTTPTITAVGNCEGSTPQWMQTSIPPDGSIRGLATIGTNIFSGSTYSGIYYSPDNGVTWTQRNGAFPNIKVYCLIANGSDLYAGTGGTFGRGIYKSSDNGLTWTDITPSGMDLTIDVKALAIDGTNIFAGTVGGDGVFKSPLSGISTGSWTTFSTGFLVGYEDILALAISGTNILAGTAGDGVWVSPTNTANWYSTQPPSYINALDVIGSTILAGDYSGILYRSTDNGQTWSSQSPAQFANTQIISIIHLGNTIYAGTVYGAVLMSTDDGVTWTAFNDGFKDSLGNWYCNNINVRSFSFIGNRIFAGTDCGVWTYGACSDAIDVLSNGDITFCQGSSVVLTSSSATGNTWSNGATTQSTTVTSSGSYSVTVSNGSCSATSATITLNSKLCFNKQAQTAANENSSPSVFEVKAYPNPYSSNFNLTVTTSSEEKISVFIYDMLGKLIDKKEVRPREVPQLQIGGNYPTGIYNIIVSQGTEVKTFRVIKR